MNFKNKFTVAFDFSEKCVQTVTDLIIIAEQCNAELELIYVIEENSVDGILNDPSYIKDIENKIYLRFNELLINTWGNNHSKIKLIPLKGKVAAELIEHTKSNESNLLIYCCSSQQNSTERYIGSNSQRVIANCLIPVLTIDAKLKNTFFNHILIPLDSQQFFIESNSLLAFLNGQHVKQVSLIYVLYETDDFRINKHILKIDEIKSSLSAAGIKVFAEVIKSNYDLQDASKVINRYIERGEMTSVMILNKKSLPKTEFHVQPRIMDILLESSVPVITLNY